jgi:hypothetical protein
MSNNKEFHRQFCKNWRKSNPNKVQEYNRNYYQSHKGYFKKHREERYQKNKEQEKNQVNNYRHQHPEMVKKINKIQKCKRRNLGNVVFWRPKIITSDMDFHHTNLEGGVWIPRTLHKSIRHNILTGLGMTEINNLVFDYILSSIMGV